MLWSCSGIGLGPLPGLVCHFLVPVCATSVSPRDPEQAGALTLKVLRSEAGFLTDSSV